MDDELSSWRRVCCFRNFLELLETDKNCLLGRWLHDFNKYYESFNKNIDFWKLQPLKSNKLPFGTNKVTVSGQPCNKGVVCFRCRWKSFAKMFRGVPPITRGIFARLFFKMRTFFGGRFFLKSTDHSTVGESENDHLACTPKRQWILSGRSDQKPNPPKNELD